ncbi:hypothetical protein CLOLEP_02978 [[Clostridium] leptum DSM 753]|uniref:Uncharacterized protein n=1 Tax=[Clostridium] leptum DSM 753 TaxID=428125 RepID=A7VWL3_9FIRM|nr:hypothetical protein CLOLEP_02978 [[Clostridium] leptum DSM 753]
MAEKHLFTSELKRKFYGFSDPSSFSALLFHGQRISNLNISFLSKIKLQKRRTL